ncbi:MAG: AAA family ATPase [Bacteroidota bacterium]|nr:AAA family ATPase [Bacteroidota bacterium]
MGVFKTNEDEFRRLYNTFLFRLRKTKMDLVRYFEHEVDWNNRFIAVRGARGCGKTTFLFQYIKNHLPLNDSILYVSLDDLYFTTHRLIDFADDFVMNGGTHLFLDEVHKYPTWSLELKTIYDTYDELKIIITSSSILEIYKGNADLSRRMICYDMEGLSFREYLHWEHNLKIDKIPLNDLVSNHVSLAMEITSKIKIIPAFKDYLQYGYYPYFKEGKSLYHQKLSNTVSLSLEVDLPAIHSITYANVYKLKRLLSFLAMNGPYKPDITKLSGQLEVSRNSLLSFLDYLKGAKVLNLLKTEKGNESIMTKPEKVFLNNTNLMYAIGADVTDIGAIRETFFFNQLAAKNKVGYSEAGDFKVNEKYTFEIGGKSKDSSQIKGIADAYLGIDGIELGMGNRVPLWMFGLTY